MKEKSITNIIFRLAISVITLLIVSYLLAGFTFNSFWAVIVTSVVLGVVNKFIKPILQIIALPISIITFGVAAFLINVVLLWATSRIVPGFHIFNFFTAVIASILISLTSWFLNSLAND